MSIPFDSRALLCTAMVVTGMAGLAHAELPGLFGGQDGVQREGGVPLDLGEPVQGDERRQIIFEVLRFEAAIHQRDQVCTQRASRGLAFDRRRQQIDLLRNELRKGPHPAFQRSLNGALDVQYGWRRPDPAVINDYSHDGRIAPELSRELSEAANALAIGPASLVPPVAVTDALLASPLRSQKRGCASLSFTAPAIQGDLAFVETSFVCGSLCGNGSLYALRRRNGLWQLEGVAFTWIS